MTAATPAATPAAAPPPSKRPPLDLDYPKVRLAMITLPKHDAGKSKVVVREGFNCVFLDFETGNITEKTIQLTIPEVRAITDHMNRVCRRILSRPNYRP